MQHSRRTGRVFAQLAPPQPPTPCKAMERSTMQYHTSYCSTSPLFSAASTGMFRPSVVDTPCLYATCCISGGGAQRVRPARPAAGGSRNKGTESKQSSLGWPGRSPLPIPHPHGWLTCPPTLTQQLIRPALPQWMATLYCRWAPPRTNLIQASPQAHPPCLAALDAVLRPKLEQGGGGGVGGVRQARPRAVLRARQHLQQVREILLCVLQGHKKRKYWYDSHPQVLLCVLQGHRAVDRWMMSRMMKPAPQESIPRLNSGWPPPTRLTNQPTHLNSLTV